MLRITLLSLAVLVNFLAAFIVKAQPKDSLSVMAFSTENLYDFEHPNPKDHTGRELFYWTYQPLEVKKNLNRQMKKKNRSKKGRKQENRPHPCLSLRKDHFISACKEWDWDQEFVETKLQRVKKVIEFSHKGGPDIVFLTEIQKSEMLCKLLNIPYEDLPKHQSILTQKNYQVFHKQSAIDYRGIQTGFLVKLEDPKRSLPVKMIDNSDLELVVIDFDTKSQALKKDNREMVVLRIEDYYGMRVALIGIHWPEPQLAIEEPTVYLQAMQQLDELGLRLYQEGYDLIIAGGDFNITEKTNKRAFKALAEKKWILTTSFRNHLDVEGTSFFEAKGREEWSFLQLILIYNWSKSGRATWNYDTKSLKVHNDFGFQSRKIESKDLPGKIIEIPHRLIPDPDGSKITGFSDHWPISIKINLN